MYESIINPVHLVNSMLCHILATAHWTCKNVMHFIWAQLTLYESYGLYMGPVDLASVNSALSHHLAWTQWIFAWAQRILHGSCIISLVDLANVNSALCHHLLHKSKRSHLSSVDLAKRKLYFVPSSAEDKHLWQNY